MNSMEHQYPDGVSKSDDATLDYRKNAASSENEFMSNVSNVTAIPRNDEIESNGKSLLQSSENDYENHIVDHYTNNYVKQHLAEDIKVSENINVNEFDYKIAADITKDNNYSSQSIEKHIENDILDPEQDSFLNKTKNDLQSSLETSTIPKSDIANIIFKEQENDSNSLKPNIQKKQYDDEENEFHNESAHGSPKRNENEKFISSEDLLADFASPKIDSFEETNLPKNANISKSSQSLIEPLIPEKTQMIQVEEIFYKFGLDTWFKPNCLHPRVESLIYWRDVKKSGLVFGIGMIVLLAISCYSVISVIAYSSLISLTGAIAYRIYKNVLAALQKTSDGHPFKEYLDWDINLSQDKVQNVCTVVVAHLNAFTSEIRRLFLVEDLVDSLKFGVILWVLTYVGSWFNGMTLVILAFISIFSLPKVYEQNKQIIDQNLDIARSKLLEITDKVKAAVPIGKKATVSDKDK